MVELGCTATFQQALEAAGDSWSPFHQVLQMCLKWVLITFAVSTVTQNYSQVDKLWSILPAVYAWMAVGDDHRTFLMAVLATIWSVRLTYNFGRRGGYTWPPWDGGEDYRWEIVQKGDVLAILKDPKAWTAFNFGFISLYQNFLLLAIAAPSLVAFSIGKECSESNSLNVLDLLATIIFLFFVAIETMADNQQYQFQTEKHRRKNSDEPLTGDYADGFCQSGLFAIVRKPNYAAEQCIWVCFYLFSVAATGKAWNWSGTGSILLIMLFQGSGWLTEKITRQKYAKYNVYMKQVPLYIPNLIKLLNASREGTKND